MDFFRDHLLSIITYTPLVGAALLMLPPFKRSDDAVRWVANLFGFAGFLVSLPLWFWFQRGAEGFQFVERHAWIPSIGVQYLFEVDGISTLLILLTTLLGFIAILSSWTAITVRVRQYYIFLLLLQVGMLGVFCALDMFLFYVFWEVMLVPMYFLIGIWGSARRLYAAIKFFLYTLVGSVVMLLGILALYFHSRKLPGLSETGTFDVTQWYLMGIPADLQYWCFLAFFLGFAIKVPMFPFHTWLPDAHVEAPTAGSVILAGVLLKMGTYGFIRFSLPLFPSATLDAVPWMVALSIISIVYAAFPLIIFLASMGLPLLNGFIGEFMILQAAFAANPVWAYWAVSGVVLGAAYLLWLFQRVFWGKVTHEENEHLVDLNARELATLVPLVVLCFWIGVYPKPFLDFLHEPAARLAGLIQPEKFGGQVAHAAAALPTTPIHDEPVVPEKPASAQP